VLYRTKKKLKDINTMHSSTS